MPSMSGHPPQKIHPHLKVVSIFWRIWTYCQIKVSGIRRQAERQVLLVTKLWDTRARWYATAVEFLGCAGWRQRLKRVLVSWGYQKVFTKLCSGCLYAMWETVKIDDIILRSKRSSSCANISVRSLEYYKTTWSSVTGHWWLFLFQVA